MRGEFVGYTLPPKRSEVGAQRRNRSRLVLWQGHSGPAAEQFARTIGKRHISAELPGGE